MNIFGSNMFRYVRYSAVSYINVQFAYIAVCAHRRFRYHWILYGVLRAIPCCSLAIKSSASQSRAPLHSAICESGATPCTKVDLVHGVTTTLFVNFRNSAEYCHFDQNGGILPRKNSAKIRMVGSYVLQYCLQYYPAALHRTISRKRCLWRKMRDDPSNTNIAASYTTSEHGCKKLEWDYGMKKGTTNHWAV